MQFNPSSIGLSTGESTKVVLRMDKKRMLSRVGLLLAIALGLTNVVHATAIISLTNYNVPTDTPSFSIPVNVSGGDTVTGGVFIFEISQGGIFPSTGSPSFVSVNMTTGGILASAAEADIATQFSTRTGNATVVNAASINYPTYTPTSSPAIKVKEGFLLQNDNTVIATGLLGTLVVNTVGVPAGVYDLKITSMVTFQGGGDTTAFTTPTGNASISFTNGTITVTAVPEPTTLVLGLFAAFGLGAVALGNRRSRRQCR